MKRPFGLIGLMFLFVLAVVFYVPSQLTVWVIAGLSAAAVLAGVIVRIVKHDAKLLVRALAGGLAAFAAISSLFLFRNYCIAPILDNYSEREIYVEGYICDELQLNRRIISFTVQAERIDGEPSDVKLRLSTVSSAELHPFDSVSFSAVAHESSYNHFLSRRIYLYAFDDGSGQLEVTGRHENTIDFFALLARQALRRSLDNTLSPDAAAMAKAVMLGDKDALDSGVRDDFTKSGVSYLIVVSGMHLAIVTLLLRRVLRYFYVNDFVAFGLIAVFILAFIALTGFANSVTRAGIMMLMFYAATLFLRQSDSINSLGIAALFFTVPNPYIVGDVGLLLSFSATFGIVLWADKMMNFMTEKLRLKPSGKKKSLSDGRLRRLIRWLLLRLINLLAVSISASLWVMPVTILLLGAVSPLSVVISIFAYPLTFVILALSLPVALVGLIPYVRVITVPFAAIINVCAWLLQNGVHLFAELTIARVRTDAPYWYIWLGVTVLLVLIGYRIHAKRSYVGAAVFLSAVTLSIGASLTALLFPPQTALHIDRTKSGYVLTVEKNGAVTLLGAAGTQSDKKKALESVAKDGVVEIVLIPTQNSRGSYTGFLNDYEVGKLVEFSDGKSSDEYSDGDVFQFGNNTTFLMELSDDTEACVTALNKKVYTQLYSDEASVLIVPDKGDAADLTEEMRGADYILLKGSVKHAEQLPKKTLLAVSEKALGDCPGCLMLEPGTSAEINMKTKELVTE